MIEDLNEGFITISKEPIANMCFISKIEPNNVNEALKDEYWINSMPKKLGQYERNKFWELVPRLSSTNIVRTKWIYKNKSDGNGNVIRNKARLVA